MRSRRAISVSPRPVRTSRPSAAGTRAASPRSRRAEVMCAARARETPSRARRCSRASHGQSARRSSARFSAGLSSVDSRQLGTSRPDAPAAGAVVGVRRASGRSSGSTPCGTARSRTALSEMAALTECSRQIAPSGGERRLSLERQDGGHGEARQQPARVAQAHLVRHQQQHRTRERPCAQPPEPVGEARSVGAAAHADDSGAAAVRERGSPRPAAGRGTSGSGSARRPRRPRTQAGRSRPRRRDVPAGCAATAPRRDGHAAVGPRPPPHRGRERVRRPR